MTPMTDRTKTERPAPERTYMTRTLAASLLVAGGLLAASALAVASGVHPLVGPLTLVVAILAAGLVLRRVAGTQVVALAIMLAAVVVAATLVVLPEHPELLPRLLPVLGSAAGGMVVIRRRPACGEQSEA